MGMTDMQANDWKKIGLRIQNAIENTGNTQKKIAEEVGLTQETLSKYINARRMPSAFILQKISKVCGVSLEWLLGCDTPHKRIEMINSYLVMDDEDYQYYDNHGILTRCRDCGHFTESGVCNYWHRTVTEDKYCSEAVRKNADAG